MSINSSISRLTLDLQWTNPPDDAEAKLRASLGAFGVTLTQRAPVILILNTRGSGPSTTHQVLLPGRPPVELSGATLPMEELTRYALKAALAGRWPSGPPDELVIGFHCGLYEWNRGDAHLLLRADETHNDEVRERFGTDLDTLYSALTDPRPFRIVLKLAVTPGVAMRIGWVFRENTNMPVCFDGGPNFPDPWESEDAGATPDQLWLHAVEGEPTLDEADSINLVVLLSKAAQPEVYESWKKRHGQGSATLIHDEKLMIPVSAILAWARALCAQILKLRRGAEGNIRTVRLFMSGPISLAYAVGRLLNAVSRVEIYDRDPTTESYVRRFTLER